MLKILVALALSMVSGAWLLASARPGLRQTLPGSGLLLQAQGPQQTGLVPPTPSHWPNIVVRCENTLEPKQLSTNSFEIDSQAHLAITPSGLIRVLPAWAGLQSRSGTVSRLVIRVESAPLARQLGLAQRQALGSLLETLATPGDGPGSRVLCEPADSSMSSLSADVRQMVAGLPFLSVVD